MYDHVLLNVSITKNTPFLSALYINKSRDKLTNQENIYLYIFQGKLFCNYLNFSYFNAQMINFQIMQKKIANFTLQGLF